MSESGNMRIAVEGCVSPFMLSVVHYLTWPSRVMALYMPSTPQSRSPARFTAGVPSIFSSLAVISRYILPPKVIFVPKLQ